MQIKKKEEKKEMVVDFCARQCSKKNYLHNLIKQEKGHRDEL
jgi:hypothetical protein